MSAGDMKEWYGVLATIIYVAACGVAGAIILYFTPGRPRRRRDDRKTPRAR